MTLEGEYYAIMKIPLIISHRGRNPHDIGRRILLFKLNHDKISFKVAILMTLEGEYYWLFFKGGLTDKLSQSS